MRPRQIGLLLLLALTSNFLFAAELQRIKLQDGSTVHAEVLSLNGGVYTLKSPALGKFTIKSSQVQAIESLRGTPSPAQNRAADSQAEFERIQNALLSNGDTVKIIMSLQNDPTVKAILADTEIMAAIQRGDFKALSSNAKIKKLMNKAEIKQITSSVAR